MTIDDMIAVLQGAKEGKRVQGRFSSPTPDRCWVDLPDGCVTWDFDRYDYRIRPEPMEWWITVDDNGRIVETADIGHSNQATARILRRVKVREV